MPFITLSNLKRFLANLLSQNLVFTKSLSIATDLTQDPNGSTRIGSYWIRNGQIQAPLLVIGNYQGDHGVFYQGYEVVTKRNTYSKSETYTKAEVQNKVRDFWITTDEWQDASLSDLSKGYLMFMETMNEIPKKVALDLIATRLGISRLVTKDEYAKLVLSNGHLSINGSELWVE